MDHISFILDWSPLKHDPVTDSRRTAQSITLDLGMKLTGVDHRRTRYTMLYIHTQYRNMKSQ